MSRVCAFANGSYITNVVVAPVLKALYVLNGGQTWFGRCFGVVVES